MTSRRRKKLAIHPITTTVLRLSHEGRGIAEVNGKTTFIFGALPNEKITFRYTKCRSQFDEGEAIEVISSSTKRKTPFCPNFSICGGCSLQHVDHEYQIQHKQAAFLSLLKNTPPDEIIAPLTAKTEGYRRKARLGVKYVEKKGKVLIGFRERNTSYIAEMNSCYTLHSSIGKSIQALRELIDSLEGRCQIPQLEIAIGDDALAIIVRHLVSLSENDKVKLIDFFKTRQWHLYLQPNGKNSIRRLYPNAVNHAEEYLHYYLPKYNLTFQFHPTHFTQINHEINQQMVERAIQLLALKKEDRVLDLFCGIGNFSLPIAQHTQYVVGIEGDETAVSQAKKNATLNQLNNAEFHTENLFEKINHTTWANASYDKILLDPPRSGAKVIVENITQWEPSRIVYVSCNPATLARDAEILSQQGYHLKKAGIIDMFPHTQHVEAIVLFEYESFI